jgi:hypothetical protein
MITNQQKADSHPGGSRGLTNIKKNYINEAGTFVPWRSPMSYLLPDRLHLRVRKDPLKRLLTATLVVCCVLIIIFWVKDDDGNSIFSTLNDVAQYLTH